MKRTTSCLVALASVALAPVPAVAESHDAAPVLPTIVPVDTYTCNFVDGKSMTDLMDVVEEFNDWADDRDITNYYAALLTPQFFGERLFDVGWLGASADGNALGGIMDSWVTSGGEVGAMFNEIIDCSSHSQFASMAIRPPAENEDDDTRFVLNFSNCSIRDEVSFDDVMAGLNAWSEYAAENGFENAMWIMFPIYGESNNDYSFKIVEGYDDYAAFGQDFELMGNGGHWQANSDMLDPLLTCDIARVYDGRTIRRMESDD